MRSQETPRPVWRVEPGWFRMSLTKGAWKVPCEIALWRGVLVARINGQVAPDGAVDRIWHSAERITEAEYKRLLALKDQMRRENPDHPALHPLRAIDPKKLKPIIPGADK